MTLRLLSRLYLLKKLQHPQVAHQTTGFGGTLNNTGVPFVDIRRDTIRHDGGASQEGNGEELSQRAAVIL